MELQEGDDEPVTPDKPAVGLAAHCTSPDRTVFIEPGNPEAWIATDHTVACDD